MIDFNTHRMTIDMMKVLNRLHEDVLRIYRPIKIMECVGESLTSKLYFVRREKEPLSLLLMTHCDQRLP